MLWINPTFQSSLLPFFHCSPFTVHIPTNPDTLSTPNPESILQSIVHLTLNPEPSTKRIPMYDLKGKVAIVTGAGAELGIGRAIATRLAEEGADVVVSDIMENPYPDLSPDWGGLSAVVSEIEAHGCKGARLLADVTDAKSVQQMVDKTLSAFGRIDILVNNAGSSPGRDRVLIVDLEEDAWDRVQAINAKGTFLCCRAVARVMIDQGQGGKIINMSSVSGKSGHYRFGAYCASKFAVIGLTQVLARELGEHRINVNAICPGSVDTNRMNHMASALVAEDQTEEAFIEQWNKDVLANTPLKHIAIGEDIAKTAAFLASAESDFLTGLAITVSGGAFMF